MKEIGYQERHHLFKRIIINKVSNGNKLTVLFEEYNWADPSSKLLQNEKTGHISFENEDCYEDEQDIKKNFPKNIIYLNFTKPSQIPSYEETNYYDRPFPTIVIRRDLNEEEIQKVVKALHGL